MTGSIRPARPVMPRLVAVLTFGFLLPAVRCGASNGTDSSLLDPATWVTQKDTDALNSASKAMSDLCSGGFKGKLDKDRGRKALNDAVGGDNVLLDILKSATSTDDLAKQASTKITPAWLIGRAGAVIIAILTFVVWFICCWTCCPLCRCCRCCNKGMANTPMCCKVLALVSGLLLVIGIIIAAAVPLNTINTSVDGFDNLACTAATMLNGTLGGQMDPPFIGMLPALIVLRDLDAEIDPSSDFMRAVITVVNGTAPIDRAIFIAEQLLAALQIAFTMPPAVAGNKHRCDFCDAMLPMIAALQKELSGSVAQALVAAKTEVINQLVDPVKSAELRSSVRNAATPLVGFKNAFRDTFSFFTDTEKFGKVRNSLAGPRAPVRGLGVLIIIIGVLMSACTLTSLASWLARERHGTASPEGKKPYNAAIPCCSCCTWCTGFFFAMLTFVVGGLLVAVGAPLAGVCLIMDDLNPDLMLQIGPALGLNFTGDSGATLYNLTAQCVVPVDKSANPNLMDIVTIPAPTINNSKAKITMRDKIAGEVKAQIRQRFDDLSVKLSSGAGLLSTNPQVKKFIRIMGNNAMDSFILPDPNLFKNDPMYQAMWGSDTAVEAAFPCSVSCTPATVSSDVPGPLANSTVLGIQSMQSAMASMPAPEDGSRSDCASGYVCAGLNVQNMAVCSAVNNYMLTKQHILDAGFMCPIFKDDANQPCDALDMAPAQPGSKVWTGGCVRPDGTMVVQQRPCSLDDYVTFMQDYGTRLQKAFQRIDDTVAEVGSHVSVDLRMLVEQNVIQPIDIVTNGVTCSFIGVNYRAAVDGMCYQGVVAFIMIGQSYVAVASITLFLVLLMYAVWRRSYDNYSAPELIRDAGSP